MLDNNKDILMINITMLSIHLVIRSDKNLPWKIRRNNVIPIIDDRCSL